MKEGEDQINPLLTAQMPTDEEHLKNQRAMPGEMCEEGRKYLAEHDYEQASKSFSKAVMAFEFLLKNMLISQEETKDMFNDIIMPSYSNLALCYIKLENYAAVLPLCHQLIVQDDGHIKARYRRGIAYKHLKQYDEAIEDFGMVTKLDPSHEAACAKLIRQCKQLKAKQRQKQRKLAKNFINDYHQQNQPSQNKGKGAEPETISEKQQISWMGKISRWISKLCPKLFPQQNNHKSA